jgi:hypothetical protein
MVAVVDRKAPAHKKAAGTTRDRVKARRLVTPLKQIKTLKHRVHRAQPRAPLPLTAISPQRPVHKGLLRAQPLPIETNPRPRVPKVLRPEPPLPIAISRHIRALKARPPELLPPIVTSPPIQVHKGQPPVLPLLTVTNPRIRALKVPRLEQQWPIAINQHIRVPRVPRQAMRPREAPGADTIPHPCKDIRLPARWDCRPTLVMACRPRAKLLRPAT